MSNSSKTKPQEPIYLSGWDRLQQIKHNLLHPKPCYYHEKLRLKHERSQKIKDLKKAADK